MNVSGNVMNMMHFHDFYYLEAMRAGMSMAKAAKPDAHFRRSFERLENDIENAFEELSERMAIHIWVYLWGACLGEAQYARAEGCEMEIEEIRDASYGIAFDFFPSPENIEKVAFVFGQRGWSSGFGGKAWKQITEALHMYGNVPNAAFIDHTVDLEHNGGCVFNKTGASPFYLDCYDDRYSTSNLKSFLDAKFSTDILRKKPLYITRVSDKVMRFVQRYNNVVEPVAAADFLTNGIEWLVPFSVNWNGYGELTIIESDGEGSSSNRCHECGDHACDNCGQIVNHRMYCMSCVTKCPKCKGWVKNDDATYLSGERETWCDDCAENASTCEQCDKTFSDDNMHFDDVALCESCKAEHECKFCGEVHYKELDEHVAENHKDEILQEKQEQVRKKEGITQLPLPIDLLDNHAKKYQIVYCWNTAYARPVTHTMLAPLWQVKEQIKTFQMAGAIILNYAEVYELSRLD